jgi:Zn-dependent M28 family amino/carboxypeptidase
LSAVSKRAGLALFAACAAGAALAPAAGAAGTTDLRLSNTRGIPTQTAPGTNHVITTTVTNRGRRSARSPRVFLSLVREGDTTPDTPRVGNRTLSKPLRARRSQRVSVTLRVNDDRSGVYRVLVCATQAARKYRCNLSPGLRVSQTTPATPATPATPGGPGTPANPATPATPADTRPLDVRLREAISIEQLKQHTDAWWAIAQANGGNRAAGTQGYDDSAAYVINKLAKAGYDARIDRFDFVIFEELADPIFTSTVDTYATPADFVTMSYSGSGDTGAGVDIQGVDLGVTPTPDDAPNSTSNSGCEAADFAGFVAGRIALIKRGTCDFAVKAQNAIDAGASGVIIFNEGQPGREETLNGTLGGPLTNGEDIPVIGVSAAVGEELAAASGPEGRIATQTTNTPGSSYNVLADTPGGNADQTIVVGAHLDSVPEGAGINDNGSGSAFVLELAEQMAALGITPKNKVRFAFWGAEEAGLIGSTSYVNETTQEEFDQLGLKLNFDMLASPNHARFVYDGDFSDSPPPAGAFLAPGSADVEQAFLSYFDSQGLGTGPSAFDGRSDYKAFQDNGIPAGGLFSGAEDIKTAEEQAIFGGTAGVAFDPNYHAVGDDVDNLDLVGWKQMSDAGATVSLFYAMADDLPAKYGETRAAGRSTDGRARGGARLGHHYTR